MTVMRRTSNPSLRPLMQEVLSVMGCSAPENNAPHQIIGSHSGPCESSCSCHDPNHDHTSQNTLRSKIMPSVAHHNNHSDNNYAQARPTAMDIPDFEELGLASVDAATLREFVAPVWDSLEHLDAEELLDLERVTSGGTRIRDGVFVRPIHDQITPSKDEFQDGSCVRYLHIAEMEGKYSIGVFVFPPNARIPLHDHPDMAVLSRVLYGELHKKSLDLERPAAAKNSWLGNMFLRSSFRRDKAIPSNAKRAFRTKTEFLEAPAVTMLFPYEGNLHEFVAGPNGAAVLDVLLPPYGDARDCTFYNIQDDESDPGACWIVPTGQPEDFHCLSGEYRHLGREDDVDNMDI